MDTDEKFAKLEALDSWELVHEDQDIRGRPVQAATGEQYGAVDEMLVDKDKEHVAAVRLSDGRLIEAEKLEITDQAVIYRDNVGASRVDYTRVRRPA